MKILLIADDPVNELWGHWDSAGAKRAAGVDLIISAGDLSPYYLEFLVTMMNVPLLYIAGNHDEFYDEHPPEGCLNIDEKVIEIDGVKIAGLAGSMKYRNGKYMFTEREMKGKIRRLRKNMRKQSLKGRLLGTKTGRNQGEIDILLTHAPCKGYGDMPDLPHSGFECFNDLLYDFTPAVHCYGHVHKEYGNFHRVIEHPSGTRLINGSGMYIFEIDPADKEE